MKTRVAFIIFGLLLSLNSFSQKYISDQSHVSFFSSAPVEDIAADNEKSSSAFNMDTGDIVFSIPMRQFKFDKALMEEHFNEKYVHSEKYPKSTFAGKLSGYENKEGQQQVSAKGKLSIHGETHDVEIPGNFQLEGDRLKLDATFMVALEDYKVDIPKLLWQNIAENIEVKVAFEYKKHE